MGILDIHTGELQAPTATGILTRESIPLAPSVADKNATVSGTNTKSFRYSIAESYVSFW